MALIPKFRVPDNGNWHQLTDEQMDAHFGIGKT